MSQLITEVKISYCSYDKPTYTLLLQFENYMYMYMNTESGAKYLCTGNSQWVHRAVCSRQSGEQSRGAWSGCGSECGSSRTPPVPTAAGRQWASESAKSNKQCDEEALHEH